MKDSYTATRGSALRALREGAGVSVRALAESAGVNHSSLSRFERGERDLSGASLARVVAALAALMRGGAQ